MTAKHPYISEVKKEQMQLLLTKFFNIPEPIVPELDTYFSVVIDYWKLIDQLIETGGWIKKNGIFYRPILRGKEESTGSQDRNDPLQNVKSGAFKLSFRSWEDMHYCLIKEQLI